METQISQPTSTPGKNMSRTKIIAFLVLILVVGAIVFWTYNKNGNPTAGTATISWNANTESDLAGYKIYYGTSARTGTDPKTCTMCGYSTKVDVSKTATPEKPSYKINNLKKGKTYYFSITSYKTSGIESSFSAEVSKPISN